MSCAVGALTELGDPPAAGRAIALLGAMAELGPRSGEIHRQTGRELRAGGLDILVAVTEDAYPLADGFAASGGTAYRCKDAREAADWAARNTDRGDRILVKGSRSAGMDEVVVLLQQDLSDVDSSE
jgi:UDP-N-acetylmuramoyl-tripeptide--D-alanyl-D-alanine ligase